MLLRYPVKRSHEDCASASCILRTTSTIARSPECFWTCHAGLSHRPATPQYLGTKKRGGCIQKTVETHRSAHAPRLTQVRCFKRLLLLDVTWRSMREVVFLLSVGFPCHSIIPGVVGITKHAVAMVVIICISVRAVEAFENGYG